MTLEFELKEKKRNSLGEIYFTIFRKGLKVGNMKLKSPYGETRSKYKKIEVK